MRALPREGGIMLTITKDSHLDHGLSPGHVAYIQRSIDSRIASGNMEPGVNVVELVLPPSMSGLHTALYADVPEAEVTYAVRGARKCASRLVDRPMRWTRWCTVVVGPGEGNPHVLYTAYGGKAAPREPGDPSLATLEEWQASKAFWSTHALATRGAPDYDEAMEPSDDPIAALGHD
jgi:hypothetical protein